MKWGWRKINEKLWLFDERWSVAQDWANDRWYAMRDGAYCLADFATAAEAIAEAERLREADKLYEARP
jgi:hypothetical protein